jgi:hypothetical protein
MTVVLEAGWARLLAAGAIPTGRRPGTFFRHDVQIPAVGVAKKRYTPQGETIMGAPLIGLTAALGFLALDVGVFVLGPPTRALALPAENDVCGGVRGILS